MLEQRATAGQEWALLNYRVPRVPSAPRLSVWRKLRRLGVVQLTDGLVALPADARTREQLEWVAEEVRQAGGSATLWLARPTSSGDERAIAEAMAEARADEYRALRLEAMAAHDLETAARTKAVTRLRAQLRRIRRRDFFPTEATDAAVAAIADLARTTAQETAAPTSAASTR